MRLSSIAACATTLAALGSPRVRAQAPQGKTGPGRVVVTIRDSVGRDSLVRGSVCTSAGVVVRCAPHAAGSRFVISDLPAGNYAVGVACETGRPLDSRTLGSVVTRVADSVPVDVAISVSFAGCDMRPIRRVAGMMVGHHMAGGQTSRVAPCRPDEWFVASDSNRMTWLEFPEHARGAMKRGEGSPIFTKDDRGRLQLLEGYEDFFVKLVGTLEGPGRFGPLGTSAFQFVVDSVLSIEPGAGGDCQRALSARQPGTGSRRGPTQ